jgi:hypothetical protein
MLSAMLVIGLLRPALTFFILLKQLYRYPKLRVVDAATVPEATRQYLSIHGAARLEALGFTSSYWLQRSSMEYSAFGEEHVLVFQHAALGGVSAQVCAGQLGIGLQINFAATFSDGSRLESAHGVSELIIGPLPSTEIVDTDVADVAVLWRKFSERLDEIMASRTLAPLEPERAAAAEEAHVARALDTWLAAGKLQVAREPGCFELPARVAFQSLSRYMRASAKLLRFRAERAKLEQGLATPRGVRLSE